MHRGARRPFQRRRLTYDPAFRLEAQYVVDQGLPWSAYLERWKPEDRALVVAVLMEKAAACQMCGTSEQEWLEEPDAYRAIQHVCPGCAVKDRARASEDTDASLPGASIRLVPAEVAARLAETPVARPMSRRERTRR